VPSAVPVFLRQFYGEPDIDEVLATWWQEAIVPLLPAAYVDFLTEVLRYDCLTRPVFDLPGLDGAKLPIVDIDGEPHFCRSDVRLAYDVPAVLADLEKDTKREPAPKATRLAIFSKVGFHQCYASHEEGFYYVGHTHEELRAEGKDVRPYAVADQA
jgi:hypothetical protein